MSSIEEVQGAATLNLAKLEADVAAVLPGRASLTSIREAPSVQSASMPHYVEHQDGVSRVGALSAEAVVRDYEAAAREIEAMGAELISAAQKCESMTAHCPHSITLLPHTPAPDR